MKLLVVTQKVDSQDGVLGFFHGWLEALAQHVEKLTVICLEEGKHDLPKNVRIYSLGKEMRQSRLLYLRRFFSYIWKYRNDYEVVLVHMNPLYVDLGGVYWRLLGKRIGLWYTHRQNSLQLRVATLFCHIIFSASKHGFPISTKKLHVVGHGISTDLFDCTKNSEESDTIFRILSVGRITRIKHCEVLLDAVCELQKKTSKQVSVHFVGDMLTEDDLKYFEELQKRIKDSSLEKIIHFEGGVVYSDLPEYYCNADVTVNLAPRGGLDKVVLESLIAGKPVLTSNDAFKEYFGEDGEFLIVPEESPEALTRNLLALIEDPKMGRDIASRLQQRIRDTFGLEELVNTLIKKLSHVRD